MAEFACRQCEYPLKVQPGAEVVCPECGLRQPAGAEAEGLSRVGPILLVTLLSQAPFPMLWVALAMLRRSARAEAPVLVAMSFAACLVAAAIGARLVPASGENRATTTLAAIGASATAGIGLSIFSFFVAAVIDGIDC